MGQLFKQYIPQENKNRKKIYFSTTINILIKMTTTKYNYDHDR